MKITPKKAVIDARDPFKHALFGRKAFAQSLTNLLRNISENIVIFVNSPWGEGKTTFAQMWQASLKQQNLEVIYFDAFTADYFDDPFVSFSGEIFELVNKHFPKGKELVEFKETAAKVGKGLVSLVAKVGLRAATMNLINLSDVADLKKAGEEFASGFSEIGADAIATEIENHSKDKDSLKNFKDSLSKLAAKVREEQGFPLTIIVDELDRCRPDFALGLLERIKHLFDVDNVAFILLVNRNQIEGYIHNVYGNGDAAAYLFKFGSLFVDLPRQETLDSIVYEPGRTAYCDQLLNDFEISRRMQDSQLALYMGIFAVHFGLTLREIERAFAVMAIYYASTPNGQFAHSFIISLLSTLKIKRPTIYESLSKGIISADDFLKETNFNEIQFDRLRGCSLEWAKSFINYCLLNDSDFTVNGRRFEDMSMWVKFAREERKTAIPQFCQALDRFSLPSTASTASE